MTQEDKNDPITQNQKDNAHFLNNNCKIDYFYCLWYCIRNPFLFQLLKELIDKKNPYINQQFSADLFVSLTAHYECNNTYVPVLRLAERLRIKKLPEFKRMIILLMNANFESTDRDGNDRIVLHELFKSLSICSQEEINQQNIFQKLPEILKNQETHDLISAFLTLVNHLREYTGMNIFNKIKDEEQKNKIGQ